MSKKSCIVLYIKLQYKMDKDSLDIQYLVSPSFTSIMTKFDYILDASEITANIYCNCVDLHFKSCVMCRIYICGNIWNAL